MLKCNDKEIPIISSKQASIHYLPPLFTIYCLLFTILHYIYIMNSINKALGQLVSHIITFYQHTISPDKGIFSPILKGRVCAHEPHCSAYGKQCVKRYGFWPWIAYTTQRIITCTPRMTKTYDPAHYRVVFFSGSPIGVPFLQQLANDSRFEIVGVVSMPDKPSGRGQQMQKNIIKETVEQLGINHIFDRPKLRQKAADGTFPADSGVAATLQSLQADYFVVVAYGKIIPVEILDIPHFWSINVHGSILPAYRGASPLQSVFLHDEKETWLTIMKMSEGMDEWDIISVYKFPLPFSWTSKDLFAKVQDIWPQFLADSIWDVWKWHISPIAQDSAQATYCHKIEKEHGCIDLWNTPLHEVYNKYRAYSLWPKTWASWPTEYSKIAGKTIIIEEIVCHEWLFEEHSDEPLVKITGHLNSAIRKLIVKPEGKKSMSREDFKNGYL